MKSNERSDHARMLTAIDSQSAASPEGLGYAELNQRIARATGGSMKCVPNRTADDAAKNVAAAEVVGDTTCNSRNIDEA